MPLRGTEGVGHGATIVSAPEYTPPAPTQAAAVAPIVAPAPAPAVVSPPPAPESVSYANCSAVRAARAAPINRGDPGYSSKPDRDGDGVDRE
ncbi:excalibur calcium-binding domain-containing protein [Rhodococcus sp. Q]|uniref:excalibur calcium-binding domain-containing protein n=1 Tax=Rhodococcus sp. Q TaxID=2502252 RepID=UPI002015FBC6|nr:excalibur calcium-binding domain-containing protein [Rhodococcus sp. Q]